MKNSMIEASLESELQGQASNTPNAETQAAMRDAQENRNLTRHNSLDALWADLNSDDN